MRAICESELRACVKAHLIHEARKNGARVFEELCVDGGTARIDLALVGHELEAFELKSDLDTFKRFPQQALSYSRVFDRINLIVGQHHVVEAGRMVPKEWGLAIAQRNTDGTLRLRWVQRAQLNGARDARSIARFLWRDEAAKVLEEHTGRPCAKRTTRSQLQDQLAKLMTVDALRSTVTQYILGRRSQASFPDKKGTLGLEAKYAKSSEPVKAKHAGPSSNSLYVPRETPSWRRPKEPLNAGRMLRERAEALMARAS